MPSLETHWLLCHKGPRAADFKTLLPLAVGADGLIAFREACDTGVVAGSGQRRNNGWF